MVMVALERRRVRRTGESPRPLSAIHLARLAGIRPRGSIDSRKRGLRLVIEQLRSDGIAIAADLCGYWLAEEPCDFIRYENFLRRAGLGHLVAASAVRRCSARVDVSGQFRLFTPGESGSEATKPKYMLGND